MMVAIKSDSFKLSVKVAVSLALLAYIFFNVDWSKVFSVLLRVNLYLFGLTIVFNAAGVLISSCKWKILLECQGIRKSLIRLQVLYYLGFFFNNFLPSMVGGDVIRVLKTSSKGVNRVQAVGAVLTERVTGLITLICLGVIAAVVNLFRDVPVGINWLALSVLATVGFVLLGFILLVYLNKKKRFPERMYHYKWVTSIYGLKKVLIDYLGYPLILGKIFSLSALFHILLVLNGFLFAKSIGLDLDLLYLAVVFPVTMIVASIPISLNGYGIKEGSLIALLGQMGVTTEDALVIAILSRIFVLMASVGGGIIFVFERTSLGPAMDSNIESVKIN